MKYSSIEDTIADLCSLYRKCKQRTRLILLPASVLIFAFSCNKSFPEKKEAVPPSAYFPIEIGLWAEYQITIINIDNRTDYYDTLIFYRLERIDSILLETPSRKSYRLSIFERKDSSYSWSLAGAAIVALQDNKIIYQEGNIAKVKLPGHINEHSKWDINEFNSEERYDARISKLFIDTLYGNVTVAEIRNDESLIHLERVIEHYAQEKGLIYIEELSIRSQNIIFGNDGQPLTVENRPEVGSYFYKRLTSSGLNGHN
jgi:hypothetical protein